MVHVGSGVLAVHEGRFVPSFQVEVALEVLIVGGSDFSFQPGFKDGIVGDDFHFGVDVEVIFDGVEGVAHFDPLFCSFHDCFRFNFFLILLDSSVLSRRDVLHVDAVVVSCQLGFSAGILEVDFHVGVQFVVILGGNDVEPDLSSLDSSFHSFSHFDFLFELFGCGCLSCHDVLHADEVVAFFQMGYNVGTLDVDFQVGVQFVVILGGFDVEPHLASLDCFFHDCFHFDVFLTSFG